MSTTIKEVVFCFLGDPQFKKGEISGGQKTSKRVVKAINNLTKSKWPTGVSASCAGKPIAAPAAVFINGDLTQDSGGLDFMNLTVELDAFRGIYEKEYADSPIKYPTYIGIGNHDLSYEPQGFGYADQGRDQMWDYIRCYHAGYKNLDLGGKPMPAMVPVGSIDAELEDRLLSPYPGSYENSPNWKKYSFSYSVDVGGVHFVQLHRYGGDTAWGHANGLPWLKDDLKAVGSSKPVVIFQHFGFEAFSVGSTSKQTLDGGSSDPAWSQVEVKKLLDVIAPYNVVGIFHGHVHDTVIPYQLERYADQPITRLMPFGTMIESSFSPFPPPFQMLSGALGPVPGDPYFPFVYLVDTTDNSFPPIKDIQAIAIQGGFKPPEGYTAVTSTTGTVLPTNMDVDKEMGVYLCYRTAGPEEHIYRLQIIEGQSTKPPSGYKKIAQNLTPWTGRYKYLCYKRTPVDTDFDCFDAGSVISNSKFGVARISSPDGGKTITLDVAYAQVTDDNGTINFLSEGSFTRTWNGS